MDVGAFSDDDFDVKNWINKTFKSTEAKENKDAFLQSLVNKLQLYVQQVNRAVEDTSQQVLLSIPRVLRDSEVLLQETLALRTMLESFRQDIIKVEQDTGESMSSLEHIDSIKSKLQTARQALHEADNWTVLASDLEEVFESGDVESICAKLVSMQQSLQVLAHVPDYEERRLQLEGLKNRLEAIASPLLVQAFTTNSVDQSRVFVRVFTKIDRLPQLLKYYHKWQRAQLLQQWRRLLETEQDEGVPDWLKRLYDVLLSHWHEQVKWCSLVFPGTPAVRTLVELYTDVLLTLDPSPSMCIEAAVKQQADVLSFLTQLKQVTKHFAGNLQVVLESTVQNKTLEKNSILQLAQAVYSPYITYVGKYASYEQQNLTRQLENVVDGSTSVKEGLMDAIQGLGTSIPRAVAIANGACERCQQFTEGCAYAGLLKALKVFFTCYLDHFKSALRRLSQQKKEQEDWNLFQMCLTLLQNAGELLLQLRRLNSELKRCIVENSNGQEARSPFSQFKMLLLNDTMRQELEALEEIAHDEETCLLEPVVGSVVKLCGDTHNITFQVTLAPASVQLQQVATASTWGNATVGAEPLPDFSFAPQEYITQIGQYLMTLPQHMEPFLLQANPALALALQEADSEYDIATTGGEGGFADVLLGIVAQGTCHAYCEAILAIGELSVGGAKQLATDIDYLGNVLEDLGLALPEPLSQLSQLLRLDAAQYHSKSSGCTPRLVAAVRQMRNITSS